MEQRDTAEVTRLRARMLLQKSDYPRREADALLEWLYFSPDLTNETPRALVVADGTSIVGHVGFTISHWCRGQKRVEVMLPVNWVIDSSCKGFLGYSLMLQALSNASVAAAIGATDKAARILPALGFTERFGVGSYAKVIRPWRFLRMSDSSTQLAKGVLKVCCSVGGDALRSVRAVTSDERQYRLVEVDDPTTPEVEEHRVTGPSLDAATVLRNPLTPQFLRWYKQCPAGEVHILRCLEQRTVIGDAVVIIRNKAGHRYANIVSVDTPVDDHMTWVGLLEGIEDFLRQHGVTYVNTLATYKPLQRALKYGGYYRRRPIPLWLRDQSQSLTNVNEWHITAIEGDIGYLLN